MCINDQGSYIQTYKMNVQLFYPIPNHDFHDPILENQTNV